MRKKRMKKAAIVLAATMVFSLFSEAGMAAPQTVQAATYQKTIKNKSVKKPEVLVRADEVKVFSIKVKEVDKQIQEAEIKQPETSADTQISTEENTQQEEETTETTEITETARENNSVEAIENTQETEPQKPEIASITYRYKVSLNVKNKSKADIRKLVLTGKSDGKTLTFTAKNLKAGKTVSLSKSFELTGKTERDLPEFQCQKLQVYAKGMVSTYRYASGKLSSDYATPDKKAPVISGFVGKNSYNGNIPYQTVRKAKECMLRF